MRKFSEQMKWTKSKRLITAYLNTYNKLNYYGSGVLAYLLKKPYEKVKYREMNCAYLRNFLENLQIKSNDTN